MDPGGGRWRAVAGGGERAGANGPEVVGAREPTGRTRAGRTRGPIGGVPGGSRGGILERVILEFL